MIDISILIPTRGRYGRLQKAVLTVRDLAAKPDRVEFLIRTDDDQPKATDFLTVPVRELRGPRWGYGRMQDYYTELARAAEGRLLFVWNDDTEMLTPKWDELLLQVEQPVVQFIRRDTCTTADDTFPIVERRIFEALGHMARHCYVDTWLSHVSLEAGVRHFRDDIVFHHHRLTDKTQDENVAALREGQHHERFGQMGAERTEDANKIKGLLARLEGESK